MLPFRGKATFLTPRSLKVLIAPPPSTFAERRSILQVLKKYGKIDIFRRIGQRANKYISVTNTEDTAWTLQRVSPILCRVSLPKIDDDKQARQILELSEATPPRVDVKTRDRATAWETLQRKRGVYTEPEGDEEGEEERGRSGVEEEGEGEEEARQRRGARNHHSFETREFVVTIVPASDYDHDKVARRAAECWRWPPNYEDMDRSLVAGVLPDLLPESLSKKGLTYWHLSPGLGSMQDSAEQRTARKTLVPGNMLSAAKKEMTAAREEELRRSREAEWEDMMAKKRGVK